MALERALRQLLDALDTVSQRHEEVHDTDVREQLWDAVFKRFITPQAGYQMPQRLGMFSEAGNAAVRAALEAFFNHADVVAAQRSLASAQERLNAFQNDDIQTDAGHTYEDYFGYFEF